MPRDPDFLWEFRCEDFVHARLDNDKTAAEQLPDPEAREDALDRVYSLRLLAGEHSMYVDIDGQSAGRCITCPASHGVPCTTMCRLARMWRRHPGYVPGWNRSVDDLRHRTHVTESFIRVAELGGYRKEWLADEAAFAATRFEIVEQPDGQFGRYAWRCQDCGAMGDSNRYGHARHAATPQHPKCPPDPEGPWARTIRTREA
jgi:hypothetical protein